MSCQCKSPKKIPNSAAGKKFYVCALSQGGCGEEITEDKLSFSWAELTVSRQAGIDMGSYSRASSHQINPHMSKHEECHKCQGNGHIETWYHSGIIKKEECGYCKGTGKLIII